MPAARGGDMPIEEESVMAPLNTAQALSFLQGLDLPQVPTGAPAFESLTFAAEADEPTAFVAAGSLVSFVAGVSAANQSAVLDTTLLAQLAASKKYDREKQTEDWYKFYRTVLENVGWVAQDFTFQKFTPEAGGSFSVDDVVLKILAAIATNNELLVVTTALNALKNLSAGDRRLVLFETQGASQGGGNFQIATASDQGGPLAMRMGAFHLHAARVVTKFLFATYSSANATIWQGRQTMTLNNNVYQALRQSISDKLGDRKKAFVADLEI
jgi:hypothetical protein